MDICSPTWTANWDSHPKNPANEEYEPDLYEQADYWHDMTKDEGGEE